MVNELKKIETLISKSERELDLYENFMKNHNDIEIKSFESSFEHIFDIYNLRFQHILQQGKNIIGLESLMNNLKENKNVGYIKTTILTENNETIVIFTDIDFKLFFGMLFLNNAL